MYQIDLKNPCTVYFMGIGGISMSGFAKLLHANGFTVKGSDSQESKITRQLASLGINIIYGQTAQNITDDIDLVVYTAAIHPDNPEFMAAQEKGIPMMERAVMVGQVMKNYKNAIGISGTHGKTTTTSMLSHIFLTAEKDPTISVGGILDAIQGNIRIGHSENFITEACEYTNSFLKFFPTAEIILNIDADHLDFFKDIDDIRHSFKEYTKLLPEDGVLVINADIPNYQEIISGLSCKVITFGLESDAEYTATNISFDEKGDGVFELVHNGKNTGEMIHLNVIGKHNIANALSAIALSSYYDIPMEQIKKGLAAFAGTERRFELKGSFNGVTVVDDYAHHPTEIKATLQAAQKYPHKHLWCVFQPHTYSRTRALLKEFAEALSHAENIILADIYAAREADPGDISSRTLQDEIKKLGKDAYYFSDFEDIKKFLLKNCIDGDLLITMGAGNVVNIGEDLVK
ncbi:MAG: UDP-N-acetylmuramate--L-alanine ligase [Butyribacter sp.]|nr:UDP-N-acetylmuramate--L-alanine ligase [bacterium]MDY3854564.1 UDP-N-acetylmuramate--L-alanine ligase [Butyribacter sp.]